MGRQKGSKNKPKETTVNIDDIDFSQDNSDISKVDMTMEQYQAMVNNVNNFAVNVNRVIQNMYDTNSTGEYNPILAQNYLQDMNISPIKPSQNDITAYLLNPSKYGQQLRSIGQYLENNIMQYNRTVSYFSEIMINLVETIPCTSIKKAISANEADLYIKCKEKADEVLSKFKPKKRLRNVTKLLLSEGVGFYYVKEDKNDINLFQLPTEYCYQTGLWNNGFTFGIDLTYFDKYNGLKNVLPELWEQYEMFVELRNSNIPEKMLKKYQFYNVPPTIGWCFSFDQNKANPSPPLSSIYKDAFEISNYKDMVRTRIFLDVCQIIALQIPYDDKSNKFIMEYQEASNIVASMQSIMPRGCRVFCTPFKAEALDLSKAQSKNNNSTDIGDKLYYSSSGVSSTLFGGDAKSALTLSYSTLVDYSYVDHLYDQYTDFINFRMNMACGKYKWKVKVFGNRFDYKDERKAIARLVQSTNVPISKLSAYMEYEGNEFDNLVDYEEYTKIKDRMQPILAGSVMSGKSDESGRNASDDSQLSDSGEITRQYDSNANAEK